MIENKSLQEQKEMLEQFLEECNKNLPIKNTVAPEERKDYTKVDWGDFFSYSNKSDNINRISMDDIRPLIMNTKMIVDVVDRYKINFPITIYAPDYEPLSDAQQMDVEDYKPQPKFYEQELFIEDYIRCDGEMDTVGIQRKLDFFRRFYTAYKFTFHEKYFNAYWALKSEDMDKGTDYATQFIESLMAYGIDDRITSDEPRVRAVMEIAEFLIDRERDWQEGYRKRNQKKRERKEDIIKENLTELISPELFDEQIKIAKLMRGDVQDDELGQ